jgi:hypothetical protein
MVQAIIVNEFGLHGSQNIFEKHVLCLIHIFVHWLWFETFVRSNVKDTAIYTTLSLTDIINKLELNIYFISISVYVKEASS